MTSKQFLVPLILAWVVSTFWGVSCFLDGVAWAAWTVPCLVCALSISWIIRKYGSTAFMVASVNGRNVLVLLTMNVLSYALGIWSAWGNVQWWEYLYVTLICTVMSGYMGWWAARQ